MNLISLYNQYIGDAKLMLKKLSSPRIFVFTIIWLMFLVFIGTIAQRDIGLFQAQQKYFSSLLLWFEIGGFQILPLPGGLLTMIILFVNLLTFFFKPNIWSRNKLGVLIIHGGALILLFGGGITAIFSTEGNMMIQEGKSSNYIQNLYEREFSISIDYGSKTDSLEIIIFDEELLEKNTTLNYNNIPFKIKIIDYFVNADLQPKKQLDVLDKGFLAQKFNLKELPNQKEYEQNKSGIKYQIISDQIDIAGTYISHINERETTKLYLDNHIYELSLRPKRTYLPFEIELKEFKKIMHPGTQMSKSYSSEINLNKEDISKRFLIEMNAPLRYNDYTFYQASYAEFEGKKYSIFAVVKNYGRLFPYIASIIMCFGVLIQIIFRLPKLMKRKNS